MPRSDQAGHPIRWCCLVVLALLVACGGEPRDAMAEGRPVQGYHPERFPDIPLPPGYALDPKRDQLAVTIAGGLIRRYEVFVRARADGKALRGPDLLVWYDRQLPATGWTAHAADAGSRTFRRRIGDRLGEELLVTADHDQAAFQLRPWDPTMP